MRYTLLFSFMLTVSIAAAQRNGTDYAVFFVATTFENRWEPLPDALGEVQAIATLLEKDYGFKVRIVTDATRKKISSTLGEYKTKTYGSQDQLLLFFSMHGYHDNGSDKGYLIPKDGLYDDQTYDSWYSHSQLAEVATSIPCKRVLIALDACYSGIFGQGRDRPSAPAWESQGNDCAAKVRAAFDDRKTRKYLTAGGDTRVPKRSIFAGQWQVALNSGGGEDGILSYIELFSRLDEFRDPRPTWGNFVPGTDGDFVFVKKNGCAQVSETAEQKTMRDYTAWTKADASKSYQKYKDEWCPGGDFCDVAEAKLAVHPELRTDNMVLIPGGAFQMGSENGERDERPVHNATVSDFYLSKNEVTVAEFKAFIEDSDYTTDAENNNNEGSYYFYDGKWQLKPGVNWRHNASGKVLPDGNYNHPVIHISWNDAQAYCAWLSEKTGLRYRLPTEAEWEYAAGNGKSKTRYSWSNEQPIGKKGGNVADESGVTKNNWPRNVQDIFMDYHDGYSQTSPVRSFDANDFGLFDMTGNVWEWCSDWYSSDSYTQSTENNPTGAATGSSRVLRGGSWNNSPQHCRVTNRSSHPPTDRFNNFGFRIARSKD